MKLTQPLSSGRLILWLLFLCSASLPHAVAQDIIVKNNKEEIKAKVLEVDTDRVKYKLFDSQDGPIYTVLKGQVFMIIYKNGRRETFEMSTSPSPPPAAAKVPAPPASPTDPVASPLTDATAAKKRFFDGPLRFTIFYSNDDGTATDGLGGGGVAGTRITLLSSVEKYVVPRFFTVGGDLAPSFCFQEGCPQITSASLFVVGYVPLNFISGKLEKSNTGLFPFVKLGFGYERIFFPETDVYESFGVGAWGAMLGLGLDYRLKDNFGVSIQTRAGFSQFGIGMQKYF